MEDKRPPARNDGRVIVHFDYDCFYASVFEAKTPSLKSLPFAVQQKQIIVTCNYTARSRGLHKLQLIKDAKRICPDVIIESGEDISRFRDASKELYNFIKQFSWNGKIERLGFDEIWMDVTDIVDYNVEMVNRVDLEHSFFHLSKDDPTQGFAFDASTFAGHTYPKDITSISVAEDSASTAVLRLRMGSHLALHMRHQLEQQKGYTSTVGVGTNKLLSKLVGNMNKPKGQTTMVSLPCPKSSSDGVISFMDAHEIGKIPGIGFKLAQKLREFILQRRADMDFSYGGTREQVNVSQVRNHPDITFDELEKLLGGPGSPHGIGYKVWCLLHGVDDSEVSAARLIPRQISIEDSYTRLDTMPELLKELNMLAASLINRMRIDLLGDEDGPTDEKESSTENIVKTAASPFADKKWLAHPKTLRLSTRPRQPLQADGTRQRTMKRISHSCPLPNFVFSLHEHVDSISERMVRETLLGMFRKLHPEKSWWNLSLVNLAVTNMAEAAGDSKSANGRDIGTMFKRQEDVLRDFRVIESGDVQTLDGHDNNSSGSPVSGLGNVAPSITTDEDEWVEDDSVDAATDYCETCGFAVPSFAMIAHQRFHTPTSEMTMK